MKRIVSIQDISCVGKCSLTVALPVVSALGVECAVLPTAVLSTHTMFKDFTFRDLTQDITPIAEHWKKEKFSFDVIATGYLGSFEQLKLVSQFIDDFRNDQCCVFIDPVMADNGKLYPGFTTDFARAMARLCGKADVVVPNLTEAAFLLNEPYNPACSEEEVREKLKRLCGLGAKVAVLTGVASRPGQLGVMGYNAEKNEYFSYFHRKIDVSFHGTGDIFSSAAAAAIARGESLLNAMTLAADFTVACIERTMESPDHVFYGVEFERALPMLLEHQRKSC